MNEPCFHCGENSDNESITLNEKVFCCLGCKTVYEILNTNELTDFYELNQTPGIKPNGFQKHQFEYLDAENVFNELVHFSENGIALITFHIPVMHCSSCVWLLESLTEINPNILQSTVNFTQKNVQITFKQSELALSSLAKLLSELGYKPAINLNSNKNVNTNKGVNRKRIAQLVVAGFCFGNTMLLAFPEYLHNNEPWLEQNKNFFRYGMLILSLPVFFYSAQDYFISAYKGLKNRVINLDIPIVIGILTLFLRSIYDIIFDISPGYFDSLCGLVFFMLIGKWFQEKTYDALSFDRNYKSFYPIAITKILNKKQVTTLLNELKVGDRILIRNEEIIPADSILMKGNAQIDNSFITGETKFVYKQVGDKIFAGGKHIGATIELEIIKDVNQSYLTRLWNNHTKRKTKSELELLIEATSKYFTLAILFIAVLASIFWLWRDSSEVLFVFTAILIVACPCALSLSAPFIFGNIMRIFGQNQFYLKNMSVIEQLQNITHIVFDKTGTITCPSKSKLTYKGEALNDQEKLALKSILKNSNHPLSQSIFQSLTNVDTQEIDIFKEEKGKGITAKTKEYTIKIGSADFVGKANENQMKTEVWIKINDRIKGTYLFENAYRNGLKKLLSEIPLDYSVISGDNNAEQKTLTEIFPKGTVLKFEQSPTDKLEYIKTLQKKNEKIIMLGDGLNDAGALEQSNIGIAITDNLNNFSPSSDAILHADSFLKISKFLVLSKKAKRLVWIAFSISFLYNIVGLGFAVAGLLEPIVAAILMPISSISVVVFATLSTNWLAWKTL